MQRLKSKIIKCRPFATAVTYKRTGNPEKVLEITNFDFAEVKGKLNGNKVAIKFLASPINPSDLNMVEGSYGMAAKFPAIGGNEGVAVVTEIGEDVKQLVVGDWVIPFRAGFGCWRTEAVTEEIELIKVANDIPAPYAATLSVNPATAYRLLRDFKSLPGDVIIQNGANSMVGLAVIQMAKLMGIRTINIVRSDRPDVNDVLRMLETLGGDVNITDDLINTTEFKEILADLPPCKLAFNCIGGENTTEMIRCLDVNATVVTYGGMSKKPLTIPTDLLASKQLNVTGFWMAKWYETNGITAKAEMMDEIVEMVRNNQLTFFYEVHDFDDFHHALDVSTRPYQLRKVVLNLDHPDRLKEHDAKDAKEYWIFEAPVV